MIKEISIDKIILKNEFQPRVEIDSEVINEYKEKMDNRVEFPPLDIFKVENKYYLVDGWTRYYAYDKRNIEKVKCEIHEGTEDEAFNFTCSANDENGQKRTNEDKRRAVENALKRYPKKSAGYIAKICKVAVSMASDYKNKMTLVGLESNEREGLDGRIINISNIGKTIEDDESKTFEETMEENHIDINEENDDEDEPETKKAMFNRTNDNIGWAAWSWNPVTGCNFGCEYCYAHDIAMRFTGHFNPTFHENRLNAPENTKPNMDIRGGNRVFVCSMGELFGNWVEQEWIDKVIEQVKNNPQWIFLFLTKNPKRLVTIDFPKNAWVGTTVDIQKRVKAAEKYMEQVEATIKFVSCEPLLENVIFNKPEIFDWYLIGAKSEGANKVQPETKWTLDLIEQAHNTGKKIWMKDNLDLIQEDIKE